MAYESYISVKKKKKYIYKYIIMKNKINKNNHVFLQCEGWEAYRETLRENVESFRGWGRERERERDAASVSCLARTGA
jgi:hypothetical protein